MNTSRIVSIANTLDENQRALKWLRENGNELTGRDDAASVSVHLNFASALLGAKDAAKALSAFATLSLPELVQTAINNCENTIAMCRDAIREEAEKAS